MFLMHVHYLAVELSRSRYISFEISRGSKYFLKQFFSITSAVISEVKLLSNEWSLRSMWIIIFTLFFYWWSDNDNYYHYWENVDYTFRLGIFIYLSLICIHWSFSLISLSYFWTNFPIQFSADHRVEIFYHEFEWIRIFWIFQINQWDVSTFADNFIKPSKNSFWKNVLSKLRWCMFCCLLC